jgi:hypothetical protein
MQILLSQVAFDSDLQLLAVIGSAATLLAGVKFVVWRVRNRRGLKWRFLDGSLQDVPHFQRRDWVLIAATILLAIAFFSVAVFEVRAERDSATRDTVEPTKSRSD